MVEDRLNMRPTSDVNDSIDKPIASKKLTLTENQLEKFSIKKSQKFPLSETKKALDDSFVIKNYAD